MAQKQLVSLFICNLAVWSVAGGLLPLLPTLAVELGVSPTLVGYYMAACYLALASGTVLTDWLAEQVPSYRRLLAWAAWLGVPTLGLAGQATTPWSLTLLSLGTWFVLGVILAGGTILVGLLADRAGRGKTYGTLSVTAPLGALIGAGAFGAMAQWTE